MVIPAQLGRYPNANLAVQRCKIKLQDGNLDILDVYGPDNVALEEYSHYIRQLGERKLIIGDFNAHDRRWSINNKSNRSGRSIRIVLERYNDLELLTPRRLETHINPITGTPSIIDLSLI